MGPLDYTPDPDGGYRCSKCMQHNIKDKEAHSIAHQLERIADSLEDLSENGIDTFEQNTKN